MSKRDYVRFWSRRRWPVDRLEQRHPSLYKSLLRLVEVTNEIDRFTSTWYPHVLAVFTLAFGIAVFYETILRYIP
jgi:hypothetical protein